MPIIVSEIKTPLSTKKEEIISLAIKKAGLKATDIVSSAINKTSLDARHNDDIKLVSSVCLSLSSEKLEQKVSEKKGIKYYEEKELVIVKGKLHQEGRIVVVGFGPAGMLASLVLAENGYRPIVLERGASVEERVSAVENFFKNANPKCSNLDWLQAYFEEMICGKLCSGAYEGSILVSCADAPGMPYMSDEVQEIGINTLPDYRGKGYATIACQSSINEMLKNGKVPQWSTSTTNIASQKLAEKLGFVRLGDVITLTI